MKTDMNGCSTCPPGEERFEEYFSPSLKQNRVQYDYHTPGGLLFSTIAPDLAAARARRDIWLKGAGRPGRYTPSVHQRQYGRIAAGKVVKVFKHGNGGYMRNRCRIVFIFYKTGETMSMTPAELAAFHEKCKRSLDGIEDSFQRTNRAMETLEKKVRTVSEHLRYLVDIMKGEPIGLIKTRREQEDELVSSEDFGDELEEYDRAKESHQDIVISYIETEKGASKR